jgi:hypothetical protein
MIELLFERANPRVPIEWLIATRTGSRFCHVETSFPELGGKSISATPEKGVRWIDTTDLGLDDDEQWKTVFVDIPVPSTTIDFLNSIAGLPYDFVGAMMSGFRIKFDDPTHYFCSKVAAAVLKRCGLAMPCWPNPGDLYEAVTGSTAVLACLPHYEDYPPL